MVNRDLESCKEGLPRIRALGNNHSLWSILLKDLALQENRLPDGLKAQLIDLALWSMRYSTMALSQPLSPAPLIEVNRNLADGLLAQATASNQHNVSASNAAISI